MVDDFKREFWFHSREIKKNKTDIYQLVELRMNEFERQLLANCRAGLDEQAREVSWTFWDALFFCVTIFTTIGKH